MGSKMLLHPSPAIADEVPIEQIRLPWYVRRTLSEAGLKTVGNVHAKAVGGRARYAPKII
jgi:hypothetical protein